LSIQFQLSFLSAERSRQSANQYKNYIDPAAAPQGSAPAEEPERRRLSPPHARFVPAATSSFIAPFF